MGRYKNETTSPKIDYIYNFTGMQFFKDDNVILSNIHHQR